MRKWSSLAAFVLPLLCVSPTLAAEDGEALVASACPIIDSSALAQHLPVAFLSGLIWQESNFRPAALSPVGARGIAQFMPGTAAERGLDNPDDPEAAIPKAAELLASLRQRFGNLGLAAAAYNAGATRVASWLAGVGDLPPETRGYVMIVTRHPVEDWNGPNAAKLTDDAVFPDSSCVQHIAAVSRGNPAVYASSALWASSSVFAKGSAMWNEYVNALNTHLSSPPSQKFYNTYVVSQLRLDVIVCAALIFFVLICIRGPLKNIRDELRRNKTQLEAILRVGVTDANSILSKPAQAVERTELLRAEPAERLYQRAEPRAWLRLAGFGPSDPATAQKLFRGLGRSGVATPEAHGSARAAEAPPEPPGSDDGALAASDSVAQEKPATWPPQAVPLLAPASRQPPREVEKPKARGLRLSPPIGIGLAASAACGALVIYGALQNSTFAGVKTQATAGFAAVVGALETPLEAITGAKEREEERANLHDLGAALAQATARLDQIEHDYGARLDKFSDRIDEGSSSRFADIAARLDRLEQKTAAPAAPASQLADATNRLDKLEKSAALAAASASQFADFATRLDKLEKKAAVPATPAPDGAARLDKGEKRAVAPAVNPTTLLPPATPKPSTLLARAEPPPSTERARPDGGKPLLRDYSVEDVRFGIALVGTRHGSQQVAPGDMIPGAGRVLRIERQGGDWVVVTTLGVIAGGPGPY